MKKPKPVNSSPGILETTAVAIGSTLGTLAKTVGLAAAPTKTRKKTAKRPAMKVARKKAVAVKKKTTKRKR